jgi:molecular chaperone HtpG
MSKKQLEIHSENILPIIKKWLYTEKEIFVRELISNACDALSKIKILKGDLEDLSIKITIDKENKTLTFSDSGIGMDAEEVVKYIAQIAFSGAEDFVKKMEKEENKDAFIGHFGLGFYSSYMVASKVEIDTLSYKEGAKPVFWSCDGSSEYEIDEGKRETRGTSITLHIDEENQEFLEEVKIKKLLTDFCNFLPYPIHLGETLINEKPPLYIKPASECTDEEYLDFYRSQYPMEEDPLFWVHLNVDYPFRLQGILYFPKMQKNFDLNKPQVKLYCNRVFVSDNCKDIIPNYLTVLRGMIDSPDIPLNVSRSSLQMDRTVRQLASHISKKVTDSLSSLYKTDRERFIKCYEDVSFIIKLGILEDDKFYERAKDLLIWETTDGEWVTAQDLGEKVYYTRDVSHSAHIAAIYKEKNIPVIVASSQLDSYLIPQLERKLTGVTFQRIDGAIDDNLLGEEKEDTKELAEFFKAKLGNEQLEIEAKGLASKSLPGFVMIEESQRRMREYMMSMDPKGQFPMMGKQTFVINTNCPLITSLQKLDEKNPELAKEICQEVFDLSLLSQREIDPKDLNGFIERSHSVLAKLTEQAIN